MLFVNKYSIKIFSKYFVRIESPDIHKCTFYVNNAKIRMKLQEGT